MRESYMNPRTGRIHHFQNSWQKISSDPFILDLVQGYQISFLSQGRVQQN